MSERKVIEAAKEGDAEALHGLLADGAAVDERDEQGWTPLNWAAGRGDAAAVRLLLEHGADVTATGRDLRTPLMIARAAGRAEVVEILSAAEKERGVWEDPRQTTPYCRAYHLHELRRYPGWRETPEAGGSTAPADEDADGVGEILADDSVVYVHQDFTVTRSMWHGEDVLFEEVDPAWRAFCEDQLGFAVPEDLM